MVKLVFIFSFRKVLQFSISNAQCYIIPQMLINEITCTLLKCEKMLINLSIRYDLDCGGCCVYTPGLGRVCPGSLGMEK